MKRMVLLHWEFNPLLLCLFGLITIIILSDAQQDLSDFISIDCGLPPERDEYNDPNTGIPYTSDATFIDTHAGVSLNIAREYANDSIDQHLWTVRSFPQGSRNCYNLTAIRGKGKKYLIRARFMYGNYDGQNQATKFDLHLGVELWDTVEVKDNTSVITKEIIHVPCSNYIYVCLVNSGTGTPFISALELRPLNQSAYVPKNLADSLVSYSRLNYAPADANKIIRYPHDRYDRLWNPYSTPDSLVPLNTTLTINVENWYQPPIAVMQTAVTKRNASVPLLLRWGPPDPNSQFYVYMHFAEVVKLQSDEYRAFYINLEGNRWYSDLLVPGYLSLITILTSNEETRASFDFSLVRSENSTLPPIINAVEIYSVKRFLQSQTQEIDVGAILNIKSIYEVNVTNWQGDPCFPKDLMWERLDCIIYDNKSAPPRIKSLNLSSIGMNGNVSPYFSNLTFLENLDLSNNNLNGAVPDFLAELPNLKVLNLLGNQFSGSIPQKLLDKAKSGLELRADGFGFETPNPCEADQCHTKKSNKFVIPLVVSLTASSIILVAVIVILKFKKRPKHKVEKLGGISRRKDGFLETKNIKFTYSDLLKVTNNFQRVIGKGGFGTVYHGHVADGKQVAVKVHSQSSGQGYNEFQTEAELLTRVHHRNLTSLVGYCCEGTHTALVYEYMANGNLREHLSGGSDHNALSWSERLQIALDAAQGLDYLHNGCKPPIIHRDIKTTNILLNEKFEAKLADFGLSRIFTSDDGSFVSTRVLGTIGYVDPEYYETQRLHEKSDIYSLGIVILELITGRAAIMGSEEKRHIRQWVSDLVKTADIKRIVDPKLQGMYEINSVWKALEVAMACASPASLERPTMAHVLTELTECLAEIETARKRREGQDTDPEYFVEVNPRIPDIEIGPR